MTGRAPLNSTQRFSIGSPRWIRPFEADLSAITNDLNRKPMVLTDANNLAVALKDRIARAKSRTVASNSKIDAALAKFDSASDTVDKVADALDAEADALLAAAGQFTNMGPE